jgi:hypothetical protein
MGRLAEFVAELRPAAVGPEPTVEAPAEEPAAVG